MTARSNSSPANVSVWALADDWSHKPGLTTRAMANLISDPEQLIWVDINGTQERPVAILDQLVQNCDELRELDPLRAGSGGENPPARPPKAKSFDEFIFGRLYWLEQTESKQAEVIAQEVRVIAGKTFAITIRYPFLAWHIEEMLSEDHQGLRPALGRGMNLSLLRQEANSFLDGRATNNQDFGLRFAGVLLDQIVDSIFDTLNGLRESADRLEARVLQKERWLWKPSTWPEFDRKMLGLRRFLRQVRWAFMPPDEIAEFCSGPFLGIRQRDARIEFLFSDLDREAERALATVRDVAEQVDQVVAMRDTMKTDRLNNTIYVLTAVATVLLVPTVIAGVYGMNFQHMPELGWRFGYAGVLVAMGILSFGVWFGIRTYLRRRP
jgi:hypothetical protein